MIARRRPSRRAALLLAMVGDPGRGLPDAREVDLEAFLERFDRAAPVHLRLGLGTATVAIAEVLPRALGHRRGLAGLDADTADAVVRRAASLPLLGLLTEVAKIVACFAYLSDAEVQAAVRGAR